MNKPEFDSSQPFQSAKPAFDSSKPFESGHAQSVGEQIEPGVYGDTDPAGQKMLEMGAQVASGYGMGQLAGTAASVAGMAGRGIGSALNAIPATKNLIPAIGEASDSMLLKSIGTSPGQIKGMMAGKGIEEGAQAVEDAAGVARKAGMDDILSTAKGRRDSYADFVKSEGEKIGGLRNEAGPAPSDLLDKAASEISPKYNAANPDVFSSEAPDVNIAKNTVQNIAGSNPTHADIAEGITGLNKYAAGNRANLPKNALTDFAGKASGANDAGIAQSLGSDKAAQYVDALHNESGAFHLEPSVARGFQREMASRGSGQGFIMSAVQKAADAGGYRAASKGLNALQEGLTGPGPAGTVSHFISNPGAYGKFAPALSQAIQSGGSQGFAATNFLLSGKYPEYQQLIQSPEQNDNNDR